MLERVGGMREGRFCVERRCGRGMCGDLKFYMSNVLGI